MGPTLRWAVLPVLLSTTLAACMHAVNYPDVAGPRYEGRHAIADPDPVLRVVTFNVKWGKRVDTVIELLRTTTELRDADLVFLQEMSGDGVERVAGALGYDYVYYPAVRHPVARQDFGNAVLTRWPLIEDRKIVLPERHRLRNMQRIAVAATVAIAGTPVRVYSLHLETPSGIEAPQRRHQVQAVVADAAGYKRVIVAGDFNNRNQVGSLMKRAGYHWLTERLSHTISIFTWDHIFVRGLTLRAAGSVGVVRQNLGASDHRPVWAELALSQPDVSIGRDTASPAVAVRNP
jgi:endonuclease/exonuclease/phosphatase family metal-dependent hydrolase